MGEIRQFKITDLFEFPLELDMEPYTTEGIAKKEAIELEKKNREKEGDTGGTWFCFGFILCFVFCVLFFILFFLMFIFIFCFYLFCFCFCFYFYFSSIFLFLLFFTDTGF